MILYQLTQWMEERTSLQKALKLGMEDSGTLQGRINEVEQQLYLQAARWRESIREVPYYQE